MGNPETQDTYRTLAGIGEAKIREKASVFLALAAPVSSTSVAEDLLDGWRGQYHDATHIGWARRLAPPPDGEERWDDDGEPHGSTGQPILHAIRGSDLWGVQVGVVRWYGGTKLGVGGLVRAYGGAAAEALAAAPAKIVTITSTLKITIPHDRVGAVYSLAEREGASMQPPVAGAETMTLVLDVPFSRVESFAAAIKEATAGRAKTVVLP
ncbi:MAG: YigZ family protein [bacterium]